MGGSWIRPRSTDPNVLVVHSLDVWDASMGTLYGGTLYAGPNARGASPPRVIIGDAANGLQVYDDDGILCASISWRNGSGRFGRLGSPGITWANGNMYIDGDCNVDGSIRVSKLIIDGWMSTILEDGKICVGTYDAEDNLTGWIIEQSQIASYYANVKNIEFEQATGNMVTRSVTNPDHVYVQMGQGVVEISNVWSAAAASMIVLQSVRLHTYDPITGEVINLETPMYDRVGLHSDGTNVKLVNIDAETPPVLQVWGEQGWYGSWDGTSLQGASSSRAYAYTMAIDDAGELLIAPDGNLALTARNGRVRVTSRLDIESNLLALAPSNGQWAPRPATPGEALMWWNSVDKQLQICDGTSWYRVLTEAVS